jgi:nucleotide-binding universal stress UspA family protein
MFNKILIPLDGSKLGEKALPFAEEIVTGFDSKVTLLSAGAPEDTPQYDEYHAYLTKTAAAMEKRLAKTGGPARRKKVKIDTAVTGVTGMVNDAAEEILDYAVKKDFDMIVMATHGRTGITRWVLGDTANKVARASSSPLMLIRAKMDIPKSVHIQKILVPLDGSKDGEAVLPFVEAFASNLKPEIILLHIVEQLYHVYSSPVVTTYGGSGIVRVAYNAEEIKPFVEAGKKYVEGISDKLADNGISNKTEVRIGSAGEEIIEAEEEIRPDLVIMSTHGHSGFGRFERGSITDKVLHGGSKPLLLVRPQPKTGRKK